jgi:hypothetical protein
MNHGNTGLIAVCKAGEVLLKIWTDCGGENAADVADAIRETGRVPNIQEASTLATVAGFGCEDCRIVVAWTGGITHEETEPSEVFQDSTASPCYGRGAADYREVVDL